MNKLLLTVAFLLLFTFKSLAQNMGAVNTILNHQHLQQQQWHHNFHMNQISSMRAANSAGLINRKLYYSVLMNSGVSVMVQSRMEFDKGGRAYLVLEDKSKKKNDSLRTSRILPNMTKSVSQISANYEEIMKGSPADSCWLFKVLPGAVNVYSFLPANYDLHIGYFKMLQKGDGEMVSFNESNLKIC